jgi:hypothetical protein
MWRRIAARALPVIAKLSQLACGSCALERRIATWSPCSISVRSGTTRPLTLAPTAWSPRSVWTA